MALLGKRDGHAKVPYGTLGSERVNVKEAVPRPE